MIKEWKSGRWPRKNSIKLWFDTYKDYYNFDNRVVKVEEIYDNVDFTKPYMDISAPAFKMEDLEGDTLSKVIIDNILNRKEKIQITAEVMDIVNNMFQFKPNYGSFFWHGDIQLKNFILQPDFKVRLVDPDSFIHINFDDPSHADFEMGKVINSFYRLKGALTND